MPTYIVCVDGSGYSHCAVQVAKACTHSSDSITILTVVPSQTAGNRDLEYMEHAASILADRTVSTQVLESASSDPSSTILTACEGHCDVIVVGTRGRGVVTQALLGSVSACLVNQVHQSAVLVAPNRKLHFDSTIQCICMNDGSEHALRCVKLLAKLLQEGDHVCFMTCQLKVGRESAELQTASNISQEVFQEYGGKARVSSYSVYSADPAAAVTEYVNSFPQKTTFIAVGSRGLSKLHSITLGSTTRSLLEGGLCPILVCRAPLSSAGIAQTEQEC